eukprot:scaffold93122_cov32-Tisochrysis_lutea.AAC.1
MQAPIFRRRLPTPLKRRGSATKRGRRKLCPMLVTAIPRCLSPHEETYEEEADPQRYEGRGSVLSD